jgi:hypothetical protein
LVYAAESGNQSTLLCFGFSGGAATQASILTDRKVFRMNEKPPLCIFSETENLQSGVKWSCLTIKWWYCSPSITR